MILFRVTSHHQFITALFIKTFFLKDEPADIFLSDIVDFNYIKESIEATNIFRRIEILSDNDIDEMFINLPINERKAISSNVTNLWNVELDVTYDSFYYGNVPVNRLFYYFLLQEQYAPNAFLIDEGVVSYLLYPEGVGFNHEQYEDNSLRSKTKSHYLFVPNAVLYKPNCEIIRIPAATEEIRNILKAIYGNIEMPNERIIFFAQNFTGQKLPSNEIELLNCVAELYGRENIIVKKHPKSKVDNFTFRGYKVMPDTYIPWEIYSMSDELKSKVCISIMSTSSWLSHFMFNNFSPILQLSEFFIGETKPYFDNDLQKRFFEKVKNEINLHRRQFFIPRNELELKECTIYLKGLIGWKYTNH